MAALIYVLAAMPLTSSMVCRMSALLDAFSLSASKFALRVSRKRSPKRRYASNRISCVLSACSMLICWKMWVDKDWIGELNVFEGV